MATGVTLPIVTEGEILDKYMSLPAKKPCRFGRHVWTVIKTVVERTPFEVLMAAEPTSMKGGEWGLKWFERDVVVTKKCNRCGTEKVEVISS